MYNAPTIHPAAY